MPPSRFPPTPGSSTDIRGKEKLVNLAPALTLPPAAYADGSDRAASSTPTSNCSDSSYHPASPVSPDHARRKSSITQSRTSKADDAFTLPPPPTRSRKIIQMKPKTAATIEKQQNEETEASTAKGGKKRGGNGGTAASRKVARKTAHSLIERRRRSKMNEEFGVLKDMIPACNGQEMHKLAILQASIDYLRYLERCISDLKATKEVAPRSTSTTPASPFPQPPQQTSPLPPPHQDEDLEMPDSQAPTPRSNQPNHTSTKPQTFHPPTTTTSRKPSLPSTSPVFSPFSSTSSTTYSPYIHPTGSAITSPYIHSNQASPFFLPTSGSAQDPSGFALTSPALLPLDSRRSGVGAGTNEEEKDREAMAALLMLNNDRRGSRGMSVRDLLM